MRSLNTTVDFEAHAFGKQRKTFYPAVLSEGWIDVHMESFSGMNGSCVLATCLGRHVHQ